MSSLKTRLLSPQLEKCMAAKNARQVEGERILALFIDFENVGIGLNNRRDRFDINRVVERLVEKGKIVVKKAYADWNRFSNYTAPLHEAAIELIEIPRRAMTGKNSADIRLVVDAIDLAYSKEHIDTFVILSGDSDFSPLVSKLKELGKHVIGLGLSEATSDLLRDNCDEFIYYEDLDRPNEDFPGLDKNIPEPKRKLFQLLIESLLALRRENKEILWSSMVKDTMKRKKPSFNEEYHGYRTFSDLLEDAQRSGLLELETNATSGTYVVTRFGADMSTGNKSPQNGSKDRPVVRESRPVAPKPVVTAPIVKPAMVVAEKPVVEKIIEAEVPPTPKPIVVAAKVATPKPVAKAMAPTAPTATTTPPVKPVAAAKVAPAAKPKEDVPATVAAPKKVESTAKPKAAAKTVPAKPAAATKPARPAVKKPTTPPVEEAVIPIDDILGWVDHRHGSADAEDEFGAGL